MAMDAASRHPLTPPDFCNDLSIVIPGPAEGRNPESITPVPIFLERQGLWIPDRRGACHRAALRADPLAASGTTACICAPRFVPLSGLHLPS